MHVVIYFGVESRSQTANSDITGLVCNLYWWRILKSKLNFCEATKALQLFCPKKIQSSFLLAFVKLTLITLISALIVDRRPFVSQQVTLMEAALESKKAKIEGKHST